MNKTIKLIICILIPLSIGAISGFATTTGIETWYMTLNKPSFNPPNNIFSPVWTLLYTLMGISLYLILQSAKNDFTKKALAIFGLQLFLNFWWSILFFKFQLMGIAFIVIIMIWISILTMIIIFSKINKTASYMQIPYLLWVSFASMLNFTYWLIN